MGEVALKDVEEIKEGEEACSTANKKLNKLKQQVRCDKGNKQRDIDKLKQRFERRAS